MSGFTYSRVPEDFVGEAPWYRVAEQVHTTPPAALTSVYPGHYLRAMITRFDVMLQAGQIDDALAGLSSTLVAELQYLHTNYRKFNLQGASKDEMTKYLDIADFLWGRASYAKLLVEEKKLAEEQALPVDVPIEKQISPQGAAAEEQTSPEDAFDEEEALPPYTRLARAVISRDNRDSDSKKKSMRSSMDIVTDLLLHNRFSSMQMMKILYDAVSYGCSLEMYTVLEQCCATYVDSWQFNVPRGLHLSLKARCPFFNALETAAFKEDEVEDEDEEDKAKKIDDFTSIVRYHVHKCPEILLETKSRYLEPLLVQAIRLGVPWSLTQYFLPESLPYEWVFTEETHPYGPGSISQKDFLQTLEQNLSADDPNLIPVKRAQDFASTPMEKDWQIMDQAVFFNIYWACFCDAVAYNKIKDMLKYLRLMIVVMETVPALGSVRASMKQPDYSNIEFGRQLWGVMRSCTSIEPFLAIVTVCERDKSDVLHIIGTGNEKSPAYTMLGLLDELLDVPNVPLIKQLMRGVEDSEYDMACEVSRTALFEHPPGSFSRILRSPHVSTEFLDYAAQCCHARDQIHIIDAKDQAGMDPIGVALELGRLDLLLVLLRYADLLVRWISVEGGYCSYLSYFLSKSHAIQPEPSQDGLVSVAKAFIDQARRVFKKEESRSKCHKEFPSLALYMDSPAFDGRTPLQMAFGLQDDGLMEYILATGASPFATISGAEGTTTLCHRFIEQGNLADLNRVLLVSRKCSPSHISGIDTCVDGNNLTALELASKLGNITAIKMLIQFGASLLPFTSSSPFIQALLKRKESPGKDADALVKALFTGWSAKHTGALLSREAEGHHPLLISFMTSQLSAVVKPYLRSVSDLNILMQGAVDALEYSSALFDLVLEHSRQPATAVILHNALQFLTVHQLQRLIRWGLDLNVLHDGVKVHFKAVQAANIPILTVLLDAGKMDLKETDMEGNSLLHWAVLKTPPDERDPVIHYLVEKEPTLMLVMNCKGKVPREFAIAKRIKKMLRAYEDEHNSKIAAAAAAAAASGKSGRLSKKGGDYSYKVPSTATKNEEDIGDLTVLGPLDEPERNKRRRLLAMLEKLPAALQESFSVTSGCFNDDAVVSASEINRGAGDGNTMSAASTATFGSIVTAAAHATLPEVDAAAAAEVYDSEDDYEDTTEEAKAEDPLSAAAAAGTAARGDLGAALQGLAWELIVTREAYLEWGGMDPFYRQMVLLKLREIGQGRWESMGACKRRMRDVPPELNLWRCKFTKAGRIVFDIAQDFSASKGVYTDLIRIWCVSLNHDKYMREVDKVIQSFEKSHRVTAALRLTPVDGGADTGAGPRAHKAEHKLPKVYYRQCGDDELQLAAAAAAHATTRQQDVLQYPPATSGQGSYTLLKFFDLTTELARAILAGMAGTIEAPFRVSPEETRIISTNPGRSIILAGRSGTGKTTCACFKLFARWLTAWHLGEHHNQIFVTASGTLRREVARSFAKMRRAVVDPDKADELEALAERSFVTLKDVPAEAFPLFLSQKTYLEALDGTLAIPFFPRRGDGSIMWECGGDASDPDGMSQEIDLSPDSDYDESEEDNSDDEGILFRGDGDEEKGADGAAQLRRWHRQEMGFAEFQAKWSQFVPQDLRKGTRVPPALVWTDLVSYIKGSAEAVRSSTGHLNLDQYLEIGRKRAPNFDSELRKDVYRVFEGYEKYKRAHSRYDTADLVGHISRRLIEEGGYSGVDISAIFRDEVQDFMQGELLLDLRVALNPNALFLSGDSAQTIARGLGFRFTDIQTLFYEEGTAALAAQKKAAARLKARAPVAAAATAAENGAGRVKKGGGAPLEMPVIEHLNVNYRTHSGILDAAASTVELLRRYFPQHIDKMEREKAFFSGPPVLLVCGGGAEDMARLLSWSDKKASQVEFGAHQVVLVRDEESKIKLPGELRGARPLTVPQSKGLEFDDVLLWNFFSDSMAKKEWRVLLNYLEELESNESTAERLLSVEEAEQGVGKLGHDALRPLENIDLNIIRPLCDELKHLYTALTRAKNFVAIVDCDAEARAPFYYFLARLGLGRIVTDVGEVDKSHLGLSKVESTPLDWAQRGFRLMQQTYFESASLDFAKAGDKAMEQYCQARETMRHAVEKAIEAPAVARKLYLTAGLQLMDLAINGSRPVELLPALEASGQAAYTRRFWARYACKALERAGESKIAASLWVKLGRIQSAHKLLLDAGDIEGAAKCCIEASTFMAARGKDREAMQCLAEAFRLFKEAKQHKRCLEMLESVPNLYEHFKRYPDTVGNPAEEVARYLLASGDAAVAVRAKQYIGDLQVRKGLVNATNGVATTVSAASGKTGAVTGTAENTCGGGARASGTSIDYDFGSLNLADSEDEDIEDDFNLFGRGRKKKRKYKT